MEPGDTVLDIGANIGLFSIWCADRGAKVVAVEPIPLTFAALSANAAAREGPGEIVPVNAGVGSKGGGNVAKHPGRVGAGPSRNSSASHANRCRKAW